MGAYQSKRKRKDFPPPKKRKLKKPVYDYLPNSSRRRPKSSHSWREVQLVTLGQVSRSSTSYEDFEGNVDHVQNLPRWQSRWEIDMRPEPVSENKVNLRGWSSMPLPITSVESAANKAVPTITGPGSKRSKRKVPRSRRYHSNRATSPLTEVEETDQFERYSFKSSKEDGLKMLHKTEGKTMCTLQHAAELWQLDNKRSNKTWFLGQDSASRMENQIVEKKAHAVKTRKVFVAKRSKGR